MYDLLFDNNNQLFISFKSKSKIQNLNSKIKIVSRYFLGLYFELIKIFCESFSLNNCSNVTSLL